MRSEKSNKVALIVDNHSMTAFEWFPIDKDLSYNDVVRWMYDSLYEMNIECDVVDINALDISKYKVIITPALYCITEEKLKILNDFVKDGGVLISSFKSFITDEYVKVFLIPNLITFRNVLVLTAINIPIREQSEFLDIR